jgi:hypothetical protein
VGEGTAARLRSPRWWDVRAVGGVLLILAAIVVGARVFAGADHTSAVYVASHDLVPGQRITAADLSVARARLTGQAGFYVSAAAPAPVGYVVTRFVGAHELVPLGALASRDPDGSSRLVTVPVSAGHLPDGLGRGDLVDVYVTAKATSGSASPAPVLVATGLPVEDTSGGSRTFAGGTTESVVLGVPAGDVVSLVHAVESGAIDLVLLPPQAAALASPQPAAP